MSRRSHSRSRTPVAHHLRKSKSPKLKRKKPEWDNSIHDLSVYKATEEDLLRRKLSHQSTNFDLVKEDKIQKRVIQAQKNSNINNGVIREISINEKELEDVVGKSDNVISMARKLLKHESMKHVSYPSIARPISMANKCNLLPDEVDDMRHKRNDYDSSRTEEECASSTKKKKLKLLNDLKRMQSLLTTSLDKDISVPKTSKVNYLNDDSDSDDCGDDDDDCDSPQTVVSSSSNLPNMTKRIVDNLKTNLHGKPSDENFKLLEVVVVMVDHFENVIDRLKIETTKREEAEEEIKKMKEKILSLEVEMSVMKEESNSMKNKFENIMKENNQIVNKLKSSHHHVEVAKKLDVAGSNLVDQHQVIHLQPYMQLDSPSVLSVGGRLGQEEVVSSSHSSRSILKNSNKINQNLKSAPRLEVKHQLENLDRQKAEALRMLNELTLLEQRKSSSNHPSNLKKSTSTYSETALHER